jgi:hypothetical protein
MYGSIKKTKLIGHKLFLLGPKVYERGPFEISRVFNLECKFILYENARKMEIPSKI